MGESNYSEAPIEEPTTPSEGEADATIPAEEIPQEGGSDSSDSTEDGGEG